MKAVWALALAGVLGACQRQAPLPVYPIGANFCLESTEGPFSLDQLPGVKLLYFGYTSCPDACPTALGRALETSRLLETSGDPGFAMVFVSVDPQRDSPAKIQEYVDFFGLAGIGLTDSEEEVAKAASSFAVFYERSPSTSGLGYLVDHSTSMYLLDGSNRVRQIVDSTASADQIAGWVRELAAERAVPVAPAAPGSLADPICRHRGPTEPQPP